MMTSHGSQLILPVSERDHSQGPATAPVTLVEYGDYECPYCGAAYPIVKEIQQRLGDRLRFVFRNFPLRTDPAPQARPGGRRPPARTGRDLPPRPGP